MHSIASVRLLQPRHTASQDVLRQLVVAHIIVREDIVEEPFDPPARTTAEDISHLNN
jgi:hypothetical protein